jgi:excisionase family DNA binding protein
MVDTDSTIIYNGVMSNNAQNKGASMPERFYTAEELADYLKVSGQTVRAWIREKKVKATKFGRSWRIADDELKRLVAEGVPED